MAPALVSSANWLKLRMRKKSGGHGEGPQATVSQSQLEVNRTSTQCLLASPVDELSKQLQKFQWLRMLLIPTPNHTFSFSPPLNPTFNNLPPTQPTSLTSATYLYGVIHPASVPILIWWHLVISTETYPTSHSTWLLSTPTMLISPVAHRTAMGPEMSFPDKFHLSDYALFLKYYSNHWNSTFCSIYWLVLLPPYLSDRNAVTFENIVKGWIFFNLKQTGKHVTSV